MKQSLPGVAGWRWMLGLAAGLLLVACGRLEDTRVRESAALAPAPLAEPAAAPTPTLMKKFIEETQVAAAVATEAVLPAPTYPLPTMPPEPTRIPVLGFLKDCTEKYRHSLLQTNCWVGAEGDGYVSVYAGASKDDPEKGLIMVQRMDADGMGVEQGIVYETPVRGGSIAIVQVVYPYVEVYNAAEEHFVFNLVTREWVAGLPTATPDQ
jgi:hypothetical protein